LAENQSTNCIFFFSTAVKKICDIYDWDGKGELDMFFLGDVMYALGMNTTKKVSQENPPGYKKSTHHILTIQSRKSASYPSGQENRHVLTSYLTTFFCRDD
jgi:hypothetical protein